MSVTAKVRAALSSKVLMMERRAAAKLARVAHPPRDMQLQILKRFFALPKEQKGKVAL
jgi:hypothetical protein